jgi:hypothetical protein
LRFGGESQAFITDAVKNLFMENEPAIWYNYSRHLQSRNFLSILNDIQAQYDRFKIRVLLCKKARYINYEFSNTENTK